MMIERAQELLGVAGERQMRYATTGDPADLHAAIAACDEVIRLRPGMGMDEIAHLIAAAVLVQLSQYGQASEPTLSVALQHCDSALSGLPPRSVLSAEALKNQADALTIRYPLTLDPTDLLAAERSARQAVQIIRDPTAEDREFLDQVGEETAESMVMTLAACLLQKCMVLQTLDSIDETVDLCREAAGRAGSAPSDHVAKALGNLSIALRLKYRRDGDGDVLQEAIAAAEKVLHVAPATSPSRYIFRHDLGLLYFFRFRHTRAPADLDAAIEFLSAVAQAPDALILASMWTDLGLALLARADLTGSDADLAAGFRAYETAVERSSPGVQTVVSLSNLAYAHRRVAASAAGRTGTKDSRYYAGIATAVGRYEEARIESRRAGLDFPPSSLGGLLFCLVELAAAPPGTASASGSARAEAIQLGSEGLARSDTSWPLDGRVLIRVYLAHAHALGADWPAAVESFELALSDLRELAAVGIRWADIAHRMADTTPFISDAVMCAIKLGDLGRAVRMIELGRALISTNALKFDVDLSRLDGSHPQLADRVRGLTTTTRDHEVAESGDTGSAVSETGLHGLLDEIRSLRGFRDFGRYQPRLELEALRGRGPTVALVASTYGCAVLVATADGIDARPIPDLGYPEVLETVGRFVDAIERFETRERAQDTIESDVAVVLEWGWETFGRAALDLCGLSRAPGPGEAWPRVWWCPLGPLAVLPVHAFGRGDGDESVLDRAISSYAISVIPQRDRSWTGPVYGPQVAALVVDSPPDHSPLPGARAEAAVLSHIYPPTVRLDSATADQAMRHLGSADIVHFACHGYQVVEGGEMPALLMHDRLLGTDEIAQQVRGHGRLAFASACSTAAGQFTVPDEVLSVGAGLQTAGYDHVVGTLWACMDKLGPRVAESFYRGLSEREGVFAVDDSATALHGAVRELRGQTGNRRVHWAAYVHFGP